MSCGQFETTFDTPASSLCCCSRVSSTDSVDPAIVATVTVNDCLVLSIDWRYIWRYTGPLAL